MSNFSFLQVKYPLFYKLAESAEKNFTADPNTTLIKLRQFGEAVAQDIAARVGIDFDDQTSQADLLYRINREIRLDRIVIDLFHTLRKEGNRATHQFRTQHKEAMYGLKVARELAVWYYRAFENKQTFKPGPFEVPKDPSIQLRNLQIEIAKVTSELHETKERIDNNTELNNLLAKEKEEYEALALQMDAETKELKKQVEESEKILLQQKATFEKELESLRALAKEDTSNKKDISKNTAKASDKIILNEELTRIIIDLKLNENGWEADTEELTYQKGARPEKGKNKAIAEWPTKGKQRADYVLFTGLTPIAIVEAKKENVDVAGKIGQAERYSRGFYFQEEMSEPWQISGERSAWSDGDGGAYQIPFVYSCNGKPFVKQLPEKSGTWFRDLRKPSNLKRPLQDFHTPEGLIDLLKRDKQDAEQKLKDEPFNYLRLRDYQEKAIKSVEDALESKETKCLLAMATGTGKTRTIIGLIYRFLKTERFKRILFLVDRTSLGTQALDTFDEALLEENKTLSKIYNIAKLGDMASEAETRVHVATVQAMVQRIFKSETPPPIDAYDCIIIDEAHRGYTLDQEMTEGELEIRDNAQYLSSYRRVLDYFDAILIGMTATPAKHTTEIFRKPVYTYSYREAVADDWLIDHEPPIRYETKLSQNGIHFEKGEVSVINLASGDVETSELEDEVDFEVESFNRRVITENFNRVICEQLTKEIDPFGDEKTMIFCATDMHADMVKRLLDDTFKEIYGDEYNAAAVKKITGKSDKVDTLIRQYKNERYPSIAITVDLLTTGIDVPKICHLVFLRRVKSRILYEQMIGRATRRCDEIGKTVFKIYDPVDIYNSLEPVSTMKPLVKNPNIPLEQLIEELSIEDSHNAKGVMPETTHAHDVLNAINQRVMRILRKAEKKAEDKHDLREELDSLESLWGVKPVELHNHLHHLGPQKAIDFIKNNTRLIEQLERVNSLMGTSYQPYISDHEDEFVSRLQSYEAFTRPEDYLDSFNDFIKQHVNESIALSVVVNRPKDLTREQLKEVKLLLDEYGYSEVKLKTAWRDKTNHEIAASIVGYIRQAALGEELIPFEERVKNAMKKIYSLHSWTPVQRKWLDRIAKQLTFEIVLDEPSMNSLFVNHGGVKKVDDILDHNLNNIMNIFAESLWIESA